MVVVLSGDATQHLMWRLKHGERIAAQGPQVVVIMIGSSDLIYASFKVSCWYHKSQEPMYITYIYIHMYNMLHIHMLHIHVIMCVSGGSPVIYCE